MDDASSLLDWYRIDKRDGQATTRPRLTRQWQRHGKIGEGMFGQVFLEKDRSTGQLRAVKEIRKKHFLDHRRELVALTRLARPAYEDFFGQFLGWGEDPMMMWIYMEYFEHGDLGRYTETPFKEEDCKDIAFQLLSGLSIMHADGITHRDLKPQNIFVLQKSPFWRIKIGDFGVSKRVCEDETNLGTLVGSKYYIAPEVAGYIEAEGEKNAYNSRVDVWSVGVVTFKLLTCRVPFDPISQLARYCNGKFSFPGVELSNNKVSTHGTLFLQRLLQPRSSLRPDAQSALYDFWFDRDEEHESLQDPHIEDSPQIDTAPRGKDLGVSQLRVSSKSRNYSTSEMNPDSAYLEEQSTVHLSPLSETQQALHIATVVDCNAISSLGVTHGGINSPNQNKLTHVAPVDSSRFQSPWDGRLTVAAPETAEQRIERIANLSLADSHLSEDEADEKALPRIATTEDKPAEMESPQGTAKLRAGFRSQGSTLYFPRNSHTHFVEQDILCWHAIDVSIEQGLNKPYAVKLFDSSQSKVVVGYVARDVENLIKSLKIRGWPTENVASDRSWLIRYQESTRGMIMHDFMKTGQFYNVDTTFYISITGLLTTALCSTEDVAYMLLEYLSRILPDTNSRHSTLGQASIANLDTRHRDLLLLLFDFIRFMETYHSKSSQGCRDDLFHRLSRSGPFADQFTSVKLGIVYDQYRSALRTFGGPLLTEAGIDIGSGLSATLPNRHHTGRNIDSNLGRNITDKSSIVDLNNPLAEAKALNGARAGMQFSRGNQKPELLQIACSAVEPTDYNKEVKTWHVELKAGFKYALGFVLKNVGAKSLPKGTSFTFGFTPMWDVKQKQVIQSRLESDLAQALDHPGDTANFQVHLRPPLRPGLYTVTIRSYIRGSMLAEVFTLLIDVQETGFLDRMNRPKQIRMSPVPAGSSKRHKYA